MAKYVYVNIPRIPIEFLGCPFNLGCYSPLFPRSRRVAFGMGGQDGFTACGAIWYRCRIWRRSSVRDCEYALMPWFKPNWDEDFGQNAETNPFGYTVPKTIAPWKSSLPFGYHGRWSMLSVSDAKFLIDCGIEID